MYLFSHLYCASAGKMVWQLYKSLWTETTLPCDNVCSCYLLTSSSILWTGKHIFYSFWQFCLNWNWTQTIFLHYRNLAPFKNWQLLEGSFFLCLIPVGLTSSIQYNNLAKGNKNNNEKLPHPFFSIYFKNSGGGGIRSTFCK